MPVPVSTSGSIATPTNDENGGQARATRRRKVRRLRFPGSASLYSLPMSASISGTR